MSNIEQVKNQGKIIQIDEGKIRDHPGSMVKDTEVRNIPTYERCRIERVPWKQ